jgi:hypothetical protein
MIVPTVRNVKEKTMAIKIHPMFADKQDNEAGRETVVPDGTTRPMPSPDEPGDGGADLRVAHAAAGHAGSDHEEGDDPDASLRRIEALFNQLALEIDSRIDGQSYFRKASLTRLEEARMWLASLTRLEEARMWAVKACSSRRG